MYQLDPPSLRDVVIASSFIFVLLVPETTAIKNTFVGLINGVESSSFLSSFFANLVAGILLTILGYLVFPRLLRLWHKPEVRFFMRGGGRGTIFKMTRVENEDWKGTVRLRIQNSGHDTLKQYYWHLLIPSILNSTIVQDGGGGKLQSEFYDDSDLVHWKGDIKDSLFIDTSFAFPFEIKIKTSLPGHWNIFYWFSTEFGMFPQKAKLMDTDARMVIEKGYLGKLEIIAEE